VLVRDDIENLLALPPRFYDPGGAQKTQMMADD
jgi:hypothetical protein